MEQNQSQAVLITGASSGIGYKSAFHLHKMGFQVFAGVRSLEVPSPQQYLLYFFPWEKVLSFLGLWKQESE